MRGDNQNVSRADAIARLNEARFGSLVKPDGSNLTVDNLPYLLTLRSELYKFADHVWDEINRIEAVSKVGVA